MHTINKKYNFSSSPHKVNKKDYFEAMKESPVSGILLEKILSNALSDDINNRELFMKGIDTSYYYEEIE